MDLEAQIQTHNDIIIDNVIHEPQDNQQLIIRFCKTAFLQACLVIILLPIVYGAIQLWKIFGITFN